MSITIKLTKRGGQALKSYREAVAEGELDRARAAQYEFLKHSGVPQADARLLLAAQSHETRAFADFTTGDWPWLGFGYLGERNTAIESGVSTDRIHEADAAVVRAAVKKGWSKQRLFDWANSKLGRWYGEQAFTTDKNLDESAAHYTDRELD